MELITTSISIDTLKKMAEKMYHNLVKAVVDIEQGIMVVDAELHADQEAYLLEQGSKQENLWGINIYPEHINKNDDWLEFDSMINIRPNQGNRSRSVENEKVRQKIQSIVEKLIQ